MPYIHTYKHPLHICLFIWCKYEGLRVPGTPILTPTTTHTDTHPCTTRAQHAAGWMAIKPGWCLETINESRF